MDDLTGLILTYNEEANIGRTLDRLTWLKRIVVVDSFSTDATLDILRRYPQVEVYQRAFDSFARQSNYGLSLVNSEWTLCLDADFVLTNELINEIMLLPCELRVDGYYVDLKICIAGKPLRDTLLPRHQVLFRTHKATFIDDGHGHYVQVSGKSATLAHAILHDDRKPLTRWLQSQDRYMADEAHKLSTCRFTDLNLPDRVRKLKLIAPFAVLFYCLILKRGILDGWRGWYYALQRMLVELLLSIRLIESDFLKSHKTRQT